MCPCGEIYLMEQGGLSSRRTAMKSTSRTPAHRKEGSNSYLPTYIPMTQEVPKLYIHRFINRQGQICSDCRWHHRSSTIIANKKPTVVPKLGSGLITLPLNKSSATNIHHSLSGAVPGLLATFSVHISHNFTREELESLATWSQESSRAKRSNL